MKKQKKIAAKEPFILEYGKQYRFDELDKKLIRALDEDARASFAELAKKVGLSRDAIRNRIQKLIDNQVIAKFKPIFNPPRMGFPTINYVFISLYNPSAEKEEEFVRFLRQQKHITYVASLIGKWDYIIDVMAENPGHFDSLLKALRQKFPDLIKDYEIYGVLREYKYEEIGALVYS
ncbi:MAG: Lrp/AsnC family transcriptional regulator [Nanoarchaeota archaeon]|nr:Lrp/AsnC family transcriptional regulator [Nanoarchaeota archaeon]